MGRWIPWRWLAVLTFGIVLGIGPAPAPASGLGQASERTVLFIGNSYTYYNDLPTMVESLAAANGCRLSTASVTIPGGSLKEHWEGGVALDSVRAHAWDVIVLQEQSLLGGIHLDGVPTIAAPDTFHAYARRFTPEIEAAGAEPVLFHTWARRYKPEDQPALDHAYFMIGRALGAVTAPAGLAMARMRESRPDLTLYRSDGSHPTPAGTYLAAGVLVKTLCPELTMLERAVPFAYDSIDGAGQVVADTSLSLALPDDMERSLRRVAASTVDSLRALGGYLEDTSPPPPLDLPRVPAGRAPEADALVGAWEGEIELNVPAVVRLNVTANSPERLDGSVEIRFRTSEFPFELEDVPVDDGRLSFEVPIGGPGSFRFDGAFVGDAIVGVGRMLFRGEVRAVGRTRLAPVDGDVPPELDTYIEEAMADWRIPGLALAVVRGDSILLARGYGVRRVGAPERVDETTLFSIASCSKAFAAATIALLVDRGLLDWDDRVRDHLPWFRLGDPWVTEHATVRDLLGMRVGYSLYSENQLRLAVRDNREMVARSRYIEPAADFRDRYSYSNNMYVAVGALVEEVTGMSWAEFARRELWAPLGMADTHASVRRARAAADRASPHLMREGEPTPVIWHFPDSVAVPSGGINSTAADMARWVRFQLAHGRDGERALISPRAFDEMHSPQSIIRDPVREVSQLPTKAPMETRFWSYGMGWYVNDYRARTMVWHSGTAAGHRAGVVLLPEDDIGIVVLVNKIPSTLNFALAFWIADRLLGLPEIDWSARFLRETLAGADDAAEGDEEGPRPRLSMSTRRPSLPLERFAGTYRDDGAFGEVVLAVDAGRLTATIGSFRGTLLHAGGDNFRFPWPDEVHDLSTSAHFAVDEDGRIRRLWIDGLGVFRRVE